MAFNNTGNAIEMKRAQTKSSIQVQVTADVNKITAIGSQNGSQLILSSASISRFKYERSAFHSFVEWIPLLELDECLRFFSPPFFKSKVRTSRHRWGSKWSISAWRGSSLLSPYSWALGRQWRLKVRLNCTISRRFLVQVRRRLGSKTNKNYFYWATRKTREQKKTVLNERAMIWIVERNETSAQEGKTTLDNWFQALEQRTQKATEMREKKERRFEPFQEISLSVGKGSRVERILYKGRWITAKNYA